MKGKFVALVGLGCFGAGFGTAKVVEYFQAKKTRRNLFRADKRDILKVTKEEPVKKCKFADDETISVSEENQSVIEGSPFDGKDGKDEEQIQMDIIDEDLSVYQDKTKKYLPRAPYAITDDEYYEENDGHNKVTLVLYADGTVTNQDGNEVENPGKLVGNNILIQMESFGERVKYVRNEEFNIDYQIMKVDTDFYDDREDDDMK